LLHYCGNPVEALCNPRTPAEVAEKILEGFRAQGWDNGSLWSPTCSWKQADQPSAPQAEG